MFITLRCFADCIGCSGSGSFGPFGHVGAMIEGSPTWFQNAVARDVFIVDVAGGAAGNEVVLYRYEITNTVSPPYDAVSYKLLKTVTLPLIGGATVRCSMAANAGFLHIGTNKITFAVQVTKQTFAITDVGGFSDEPTVSAITADDRGYVTIAFSGSGTGGSYVYGPTGEPVQDGGGATFLLPSTQGLSTQDVPTFLSSEVAAASRLSVRLRPETAVQ